MTIASAFNEIAVAQGGTANKSGTIAGAIDALNDALAGSDQPAAQTIEGGVRLLGQHIGGGSSVTVEALTATENKTYTAPEGKAYSPVTVNVSGGGNSYGIYCYSSEDFETFTPIESFVGVSPGYDSELDDWELAEAAANSANAGDIIVSTSNSSNIAAVFKNPITEAQIYVPASTSLVMPSFDVAIVLAQ